MSYRMLSIPVTVRLTDGAVKRHEVKVRRSPAAPTGVSGVPIISEGERIRLMREQRFRNIWRSRFKTYDVNPEPSPQLDADSGPSP